MLSAPPLPPPPPGLDLEKLEAAMVQTARVLGPCNALVRFAVISECAAIWFAAMPRSRRALAREHFLELLDSVVEQYDQAAEAGEDPATWWDL